MIPGVLKIDFRKIDFTLATVDRAIVGSCENG